MHPEAAVAFLAAQEPAYDRPGEEFLRIGDHRLAEDVAPRQVPDSRFTRREQEVDRSLCRRLSSCNGHGRMFAAPE
jgi:hypothetical protein